MLELCQTCSNYARSSIIYASITSLVDTPLLCSYKYLSLRLYFNIFSFTLLYFNKLRYILSRMSSQSSYDGLLLDYIDLYPSRYDSEDVPSQEQTFVSSQAPLTPPTPGKSDTFFSLELSSVSRGKRRVGRPLKRVYPKRCVTLQKHTREATTEPISKQKNSKSYNLYKIRSKDTHLYFVFHPKHTRDQYYSQPLKQVLKRFHLNRLG